MLYQAPSAEIRDTFHQGTNRRAYEMLGAHPCYEGDQRKWHFCVWAPNAKHVALVGSFNDWDKSATPMQKQYDGTWELRLSEDELWKNVPQDGYPTYKYAVWGADDLWRMKADPFGFFSQLRPNNASRLIDLDNYHWSDQDWMAARHDFNPYISPVNIYEVHIGSWRRHPDGSMYSYREFADEVIPYIQEMGYTHIELLPVMEHPLDMSWGYQVTGFYSATARYGTPLELMSLIDRCHQAGIGVILDWVPAHFPKDAYGLYMFDGAPCYEDPNPRRGEHKEWGTRVFDYGKVSTRNLLFSSAMFWIEKFHMDGLRVDAVASMLYLDYNRQGEWRPNVHGGRENLEAVDFLRLLNEYILTDHPDVMMIAEESTAWPMVTKPGYDGGLGFNFKWNMGWMNDMLCYCSADPFFRKDMHDKITFSFMYAFSENYILPLSHDEVVHGKCSLISKMPPPYENQFGGLRALYGYMVAHPGKKMLFMGGEFAQFSEWAYQRGLDWMLLDYPAHRQMQAYVKALNHFYLATPQLWEQDTDWRGFEWISHEDNRNNIIAFRRVAKDGSDIVVVVNFSPEEQQEYRIGVPITGTYEEIFTSDKTEFGGSGMANGKLKTENKPMHGQEQSIVLKIPRFGVLFFKGKARAKRRTKAEIEAAKAAAAKKPVKRTRSTKAVAKSGTKAVARTTEKAVAKTGSKSVAKTTEKAVARTGTKAVAKTTEKAVARTGTKAVAKATEKAVSVPTDKAVTATGGSK